MYDTVRYNVLNLKLYLSATLTNQSIKTPLIWAVTSVWIVLMYSDKGLLSGSIFEGKQNKKSKSQFQISIVGGNWEEWSNQIRPGFVRTDSCNKKYHCLGEIIQVRSSHYKIII